MRRTLLILAALAVAGLAAAVSVVSLGLYNVSARAGHLPGVSWVLHTTFRNAVRLRAPAEDEVPDLSDPALIALGAGHYATACAPCHAGPDDSRTATMRAMLPVPPPIREAVAGWQPSHLHWIVENGVKMTGMPGWPAGGRADEVWAVVAYLDAVKRQEAPPLPEVSAQQQSAPPGAAYCATCHGSISAHVPRLDIQQPGYLAETLDDYLTGARASGIMQQAVSMVPPEALPDLAAHFAAGPAVTVAAAVSPAAGAALATRGTREVPACTACHGPGAPVAQPEAPALAGQDRAFLAAQLRLWRDGVRRGSDKMSAAARSLSDEEIALLSDWYAALPTDGEIAE
ncbi:MAG: cytochrome C [Confluentimicrobium sp.]|uniref:c-type cytochrome n=1 Tax=Actibacterium sp. TaxID=1872125 RepID=UPI000C5FF848|nr:c-type cytochrome [Actibacterium sp.]MBC56543.1 cytochrome C [Actibacterium sp.]